MMKKYWIWMLLIVTLVVSGCSAVLPDKVDPTDDLFAGIIFPVDGAQLPSGEIVMIRTNVRHGEGAMQATLLVNDVVERLDELNTPLYKGAMLQGWLPTVPGTYVLRVVFIGVGGGQIESSPITVIIGDGLTVPLEDGSAPTEAAGFTTTITPTSTVTPTPTLGPAMATGNVDSNCRSGPGQIYDVISFLLTNQTSLVVGKSDGTGWWVIERTDGGSGNCWVADSVVELSGDIDSVRVVAAPPTPTPIPTATPTASPLFPPVPVSPSGPNSCRSSVDLVWEAVNHPNGVSYYEWMYERADPKTGVYSVYDSGTTGDTHVNVVVDCGADFFWRVRVIDGQGNVSNYSGDVSFEIATP